METRFDWGGVELHCEVARGTIVRARLFSDALTPAPLEALTVALAGCPYQGEAVSQRVLAQGGDDTTGRMIPQLAAWLRRQLA